MPMLNADNISIWKRTPSHGRYTLVRHIALFNLRADITDDEIAELDAGVDAFYTRYEGHISASHGRDLGLRQDNFNYGVIVDFASKEDYLSYASDPVHLDTITRYVVPNIIARAAIQLEI